MPYLPRTVLRSTIRAGVRPLLHPRVPFAVQRTGLSVVGALLPSPGPVERERTTLGGQPALRVSPVGGGSRTVLYLHGGAYTTGSSRSHGALGAGLALGADADVHLLDYRLAPEHPFPAALEDAVAAYRQLAGATDPSRLLLAGDSAGGGLALATLAALRDEGVGLPAAVGLISPWTDLTLCGPTVTANASRDPLLSVGWLSQSADAYAGGRRLTEPGLSPKDIELDGLPPLVVQSGADDVLVGDGDALVARAREAGHPVSYERLEGLWHDFQLQAGTLREADEALERLGRDLVAAAEQD